MLVVVTSILQMFAAIRKCMIFVMRLDFFLLVFHNNFALFKNKNPFDFSSERTTTRLVEMVPSAIFIFIIGKI